MVASIAPAFPFYRLILPESDAANTPAELMLDLMFAAVEYDDTQPKVFVFDFLWEDACQVGILLSHLNHLNLMYSFRCIEAPKQGGAA